MTILEIACEGSSLLDIDELKPFQGSLKSLSKTNYNRLRAEMLADGFSFPIFVWQHEGSSFVIDGHQRLNTLLEMRKEGVKVPQIPVALVKAHTYKQAKKKVLAAASVYGRIEDQGLYEFLQNAAIDIDELIEKIDLPNFDMDKFKAGYASEGGGGGNTDEDDVPEPPKVAKSKLGDLYQLGNHRLLCGDSTKMEDVERLMGGEKAEMVFTDPPYGVSYDGGIQFTSEGVKKGQREKLENDHNADIYSKAIPIISAFCDGPIYVWFADSEARQLYQAIDSVGGSIHAMIVWVKNGGYGALNACYKQKHEPCLFWKSSGTLRWTGATTENTIWDMNKDGRNEFHPTQKPVALAERAISNHDAKTVLDLFLGSGSTLIACEKTNRKCYGLELDPIYVDVIIQRFESFTGKKAELING